MYNDNQRVVVTGLGAVTPIGVDVPSTWESLLAGRSGIGPVTSFDASRVKSQIAAEVKDFDPSLYLGRKEVRRTDRFAQFAIASTMQAVSDAGLDMASEDPRRVGVHIGSGIGGITTLLHAAEVLREKGPRRVSALMIPSILLDTAAGQIAAMLGARGPNVAVSLACATGNGAIGEASEIIRRGAADVMIAGGSESAINELVLAGFANMGALSTRNDEPERASRPFDIQRDGFVIGEGSATLILESLSHARDRGANIYGELLGYGITADAYHATAPREDGIGACEAMTMAMRQAGVPSESVGYINAHGTSTPLNDSTETLAVKKFFGDHAYRLALSSIKSMTGHLLGAGGAVEAVATVLALTESVISPTINYEFPDPACDLDYVPNTARQLRIDVAMSNSFGFGGHNTCLVFGKV
ncbi:MAG: beta-ketoacyl-ACP synthase II [Chloroflexota bacterium]|nr:beta-ketoacyl-ACP synthase II [Chloroflexota bacterium]